MRFSLPPLRKALGLLAVLAAVALAPVLPGLAQAASTDGDYRLAPGDVLEFDLAEDVDPPRQLTVAGDGTIQVPLLGGVKVVDLSVPEAHKEIKRLYISGQYFVDPGLSLSVVSLRPIFVLGDVKSPGSFPYQPGLTVEKAIGLAGGLSTIVGNPEDQIISRSRLRGELEQTKTDLAAAAVTMARLNAQLADRVRIESADYPADVRPHLDPILAERLTATANELLVAEADSLRAQTALLTDNIAEATQSLATLNQLIENQKAAIKFSQEDYDRGAALLKKGMKTASDVSQLQRQLTADEGRLLAIYAQLSEARRGIGALKRDLAALSENRRRNAFESLAEERSKLDKALASYRATEEQLFLVTNWTSEAALQAQTAIVDFKIRRRASTGATEDIAATNLSGMRPDDVLLVTVERPTPQTSTASR